MRLNSKGENVLVLGKWLNNVGYNKVFTDTFDKEMDIAVKDFQAANSLKVDGIVGPITLGVLDSKRGPYSWITRPVDFYTKSGRSFRMRSDAIRYFDQFYNEIKEKSGIITSAGADRALSAPVSAGRSATSLHYLSVAFDLSTISGMVDPNTDPYVIELGSDGYWIVWCRSSKGEKITINNHCNYTARHGTKNPITDKFINFTEIAKKYGFMPVKPWTNFFTNGSMMTAEWWHFQNEWCLMPEYSTLGNELRKVYNDSQLARTNPMKSANVIWKINWFG